MRGLAGAVGIGFWEVRRDMDLLPAGLDTWPVHAADAELLADLELLLSGARIDLGGQVRPLPDGRVALRVQADVADKVDEAGHVVLADPEGTPLAALAVGAAAVDGEWVGVLTPLRAPAYGPFRGLQRGPAEVRPELAGRRVVGVVCDRPLLTADLDRIRATDADSVLLIVRTAGRQAGGLPPESLVRAILAAGRTLGPLGGRTLDDPGETRGQGNGEPTVGDAVGRTDGLTADHAEGGPTRGDGSGRIVDHVDGGSVGGDSGPGAGGQWVLVVAVPLRRLGVEQDRRAAEELAAAYGVSEVLDLDGAAWADVLERLESEEPLPESLAPADVRTELRRWRPPKSQRGLVVLFTGLSGSGKSTLARALIDALLEDGRRTLTVLDGDVVRRELSRGLGFSQADRDLNVRRIGWVAAEVARHGGLAVCAPIAPYAATRAAVRAEAEAVGDFFLVHVATPLAVCEQRDRKGLYAKARAGLIPHFTGISDPYEEPDDAEFVVDTSTEPLDHALDRLLAALRAGGWL